jgi:predicted GNAT family acetyltransferase
MSEVRHNAAARRYEMDVHGELAVAQYVERDGVLVFTHTETPHSVRGQGYGARLVKGALDDVRSRGKKIVPACWFVREFVERTPAYRDLLS